MSRRQATGLTPAEMAFLCEMELVTIIPRQRLEGLQLLGGPTPPLNPPQRANIPLWLALLLKKQRRANIIAPPWLNPTSLSSILDYEKTSESFSPPPALPSSNNSTTRNPVSPPFLPSSVARTSSTSAAAAADAERLPYHWIEMAHLLLTEAGDDVPNVEQITRLVRELREVRMAKVRAGIGVLEGGREVGMTGVGGMEVAECRDFVGGVVDELRELGMSREVERREREEEGVEEGSEMSE